jgi:hypothetical protein
MKCQHKLSIVVAIRKLHLATLLLGGLLSGWALSGCAPSSSARWDASLQSILSWVATARMAGVAWTRHEVPTPYTQNTLRSTARELRNEGHSLQQRQVSPALHNAVLQHLQVLPVTVQQMADAVKRGDRPAVERLVEELAAHEQFFRSLKEGDSRQQAANEVSSEGAGR